MSIETSVENEVKAVEAEAKSEVAKVEGEVKSEVAKVEGEVKAAVETVGAEVKAVVTKAVVDITSEEKLFLREAELEYLKAQMEIQKFSKNAEAKSKQYVEYIEGLFKKYAITKVEYVFDGTINAFKKV